MRIEKPTRQSGVKSLIFEATQTGHNPNHLVEQLKVLNELKVA
jgi:hypothetical protein